jgi:hypothetical protein
MTSDSLMLSQRHSDLSATSSIKESSAIQQLHLLPLNKIKLIMTASPDQPKASDDGVFAMTKLAVLFLFFTTQ